MLFLKYALLAIPFLPSLTTAAPTLSPAVAAKRQADVTSVVNDLQAAVSAQTSTIAPGITESSAITALTAINDALQTAYTEIEGLGLSKRDLWDRQVLDLDVVGTVLAQVIDDIISAVEIILVDLEGVPLIGSLISQIDGSLNQVLLGLSILLKGVLNLVAQLLVAVAGLLSSLAAGLFPLTLGTLGL